MAYRQPVSNYALAYIILYAYHKYVVICVHEHVCLCVCVCIRLNMHSCVCVCVGACIQHAFMHVRMWACMSAYLGVCVQCTCTCEHNYVWLNNTMHSCIHACWYMHVCVYVICYVAVIGYCLVWLVLYAFSSFHYPWLLPSVNYYFAQILPLRRVKWKTLKHLLSPWLPSWLTDSIRDWLL